LQQRRKMTEYYAGIDIGSVTTKAAIVDESGVLVASALAATGVSGKAAAQEVLDRALSAANLSREQIDAVVTTGYGRSLAEFAGRAITEITCHARGSHQYIKDAHLLIDVGGQDSKAISLRANGKVEGFQMNDRCAAGTGRFLEVMARALSTDVLGLSNMALGASKSVSISNMCTVFAESEVVSLLARHTPPETLAAGLVASIAERVAAMAKKLGHHHRVCMSGGVALNQAIVQALGKALGMEVEVLPYPQLIGAYGAALLAWELK
jgi:predicted CoA-substrate-specific enzyme activase